MKKLVLFVCMISLVAGTAWPAYNQKISGDAGMSQNAGLSGQAPEQQSPDLLKREAINKIRVAKDLMGRANKLVNTNPSRENLKTALQLYGEAGQLFQEADGTFRYLGTNYVSQSDIDNTSSAVQLCVESINKLKQILNSTRQ